MTLAQARGHSLGQLKLLAAAARRREARRALLDAQAVTAAVAASMTSDGQRLLKRLLNTLSKDAEQ